VLNLFFIPVLYVILSRLLKLGSSDDNSEESAPAEAQGI
jgi:hypothetical protein